MEPEVTPEVEVATAPVSTEAEEVATEEEVEGEEVATPAVEEVVTAE